MKKSLMNKKIMYVLVIFVCALMIGVKFMAVKDKVKGICGTSKCNYDVYTSEKVDELLDKYAVLSRNNINVGTDGSFVWDFAYPEGFNENNTVVVSMGNKLHFIETTPTEYTSFGDVWYATNDYGGLRTQSVNLFNNYIQYFGRIELYSGFAETADIKIVLMKID